MDKMVNAIKILLKLTWLAIKVSCFALNFILTVVQPSSKKAKRFSHTEAFNLLHEGKISSAEFVECTED